MRPHRAVPLLLSLITLLAPLAVSAQTTTSLRGQITTDSGTRPLPEVEITLENRNLTTRADAHGRFSFASLAPGAVVVLIRHPGFRPLRDSLHVEPGANVERTFDLTRVPTTLAGVEVRETGGITALALRDFERRRKGSGKFLVQDDIRRLGTTSLESLIRARIGGFSFVKLPNGGVGLAGRRGNELTLAPRPPREPGLADRCYAQVFVNGQRVYAYSSPPAMPPRLDHFDVDRIVALEFYRGPAETPTEFSGPSAACGTIAIWTDMATTER